MDQAIKDILTSLPDVDTGFIDEARAAAKDITIPQSAWCKAHGYANEKEYKEKTAAEGKITYHTHYCFPSNEKMREEMPAMKALLDEVGLTLDRFGVSLDSRMAFPPEMRDPDKEKNGLYLPEQADWDEVASFDFSQPHFGDNMIGSPASFDSCCKALSAGVTTMGNMSQFFGWDYPEFTDVEARAKATMKAIAVMAEHKADGAMIHSNLDDGYGDKTTDMSELIAMALIEKYIIEDLMGAKIAHSFGDMFHSPYKRLVFLSALKQVHGEGVFGSMVFSNKLGRQHEKLDWNDAHLAVCMLYDMAGQVHYKTGHAVTVMADRGLDEFVTNEEIVRKLALAKQLEDYIPEVLKTLDFDAIDAKAAELVKKGTEIKDKALAFLAGYIDIKNPYAVTLAIKKIGVEATLAAGEDGVKPDLIPTDTGLWAH